MSSISMEEFELLEDAKYRSYMTQVDKCLKAFEYTTEWADLIASLSKLNKVLLAHMKFPIIPRRIVISKRLAQCMHPVLPAGVHQKALETYDIIFKCMGTNRLAAELFIYSAGLFPLLANAAMNVRSDLLTVYETHFVPLGQRLRPGLNGFLSGVLPGLEEGSDYYQRTNNLLEAVADAVEPVVFYSGVWECVASNAAVRLPALTFVLSHCGKKGRGGVSAMEEQPHLLGMDHDVMCQALCHALQDTSALVQRSALDLLLIGFPLHRPQFAREDMVRLVASVLSSLLRRDMSLNRRLFSWLLGTEVNPDHLPSHHPMVQHNRAASRTNSNDPDSTNTSSTNYFTHYTQDLMVPAVLQILEESASSSPGEGKLDVRAYRIVTTLLDKPEIGPLIIDSIILDIFRTLFFMSRLNQEGETVTLGQDLMKTANLMFSQLETSYVWTIVGRIFSQACASITSRTRRLLEDQSIRGLQARQAADSSLHAVQPIGSPETNIPEMCNLINFLLDIVSIETYAETSSEHLPTLFILLLTSITTSIKDLSGEELRLCLDSAKKVLSRVQPAFNIWDLTESAKKRSEVITPLPQLETTETEEGVEVTESCPSSPVPTQQQQQSTTANNITRPTSRRQRTSSRAGGSLEAGGHGGISCGLHEALISECRTVYTGMFSALVLERLIGPSSSSSSSSVYERLLARIEKKPASAASPHRAPPPAAAGGHRDTSLSSLLGHMIHPEDQEYDDDGDEERFVIKNDFYSDIDCNNNDDDDIDDITCDSAWEEVADTLILQHSVDPSVVDAFVSACSGLVELSSMPCYQDPDEENEVEVDVEDLLPAWLKGLLVCCTSSYHGQPTVGAVNSSSSYSNETASVTPLAARMELAAISCLLDLAGVLAASWMTGGGGVGSRGVSNRNSSRSSGGEGSNHRHHSSKLQRRESSNNNNVETVVVRMQPLLVPAHLAHITSRTHTVRLIAVGLWARLGRTEAASQHPQCVALLHRLLELAPSASEVENVVARSFSSPWTGDSPGGCGSRENCRGGCSSRENFSGKGSSATVYRQFAQLWHLSRDLPAPAPLHTSLVAGAGLPHYHHTTTTASASRSRRTLDLCLFKMVSGLRSEESAVRALCERWVEHCLARGDTGRLLEPILLALLQPSSARLSVLHANIKESAVDGCGGGSSGSPPSSARQAGEEKWLPSPRMAKVFAISSVDNNVIYHVSNSRAEPEKTSQGPVLAVTTVQDNRRKTTTTRTTKKDEPRTLESPVIHTRFPYSQMSLFVNPFALVSSESEFNHDPSSTPEPQVDVTRPSSPSPPLSFPSSSSSSSSVHSSCPASPDLSSHSAAAKVSEDMSPGGIVGAILELLLDRVVSSTDFLLKLEELDFPSSGSVSESDRRDSVPTQKVGNVTDVTTHPLHSHLLLYSRAIDSRSVLHNIAALSGIISIHPRLAVSSLATTGVASPSLSRSVQLSQLLARHKRSVLGKGFSSRLPSDSTASFRSSMLLEVVLSLCLYYLRSYYPSLPGLAREEVLGNREVQLAAVSLLNKVCSELILVVKDNGKPFALYISDLFNRTKVQKVVLHSLLAGVHTTITPASAFTSEILRFNDPELLTTGEESQNGQEGISVNTEAFQVELLKLALSLVMLEEVITIKKYEVGGTEGEKAAAATPLPRLPYIQPNVMRYTPDYPFAEQPMFVAAVLSALRQERLRDLHHHWSGLVVACLPFLGSGLAPVVTSVASQIWTNLESLATRATCPIHSPSSSNSSGGSGSGSSGGGSGNVPTDYVLTQLESLGQLLAYCLLEGGSAGCGTVAGVVTSHPAAPPPSSTSLSALLLTPPQHQQPSIVANLVHVFGGSGATGSGRQNAAAGQEQLLAARRALLSITPRLIVALTSLWSSLSCATACSSSNNCCTTNSWLAGSSGKGVKSMILELLSPLATVHPAHFLAAVAVAWSDPGQEEEVDGKESQDKGRKGETVEQEKTGGLLAGRRRVLVEVVSSLRMFPTSTVMATLRQVVKSPPGVSGSATGSSPTTGVGLEVAGLEFFAAYLAASPSHHLAETWPGFRDLLKDCLSLKPEAVFLGLRILHQFVSRVGGQGMDRRETRELQEVSGKLVEAVAGVAGSRLEAATWLRGTRTVRPLESGEDDTRQYAVTALNLLGELMATLLDIVYQSEEKEKVIPLLSSLMHNVVPYLRHHSKESMGMLRGGSRLLASLSEYPYTRKAWRREAMELLLEQNFFQMEHSALKFWVTTTDNLMTHDKTTFKELLTRIASLGQSNMSLFGSKELEQEQRALLLKRLAFVIFCSDIDQYQKQMPDITDRLSECLRSVPVSPAVQAAVFLCFRVIILRMSATYVTFLWPVIVTEMVVIFSSMEHQLIADTEEFSHHIKRVSLLDSSFVSAAASASGPGLGLQAQNSPAWLSVYLAVCKLLDQAAALPASLLPQFQMYKWAFVREGSCPSPQSSLENGHNTGSAAGGVGHSTGSAAGGVGHSTGSAGGAGGSLGVLQHHDFVPHIVRICKLLEAKAGRVIPPRPVAAGQPLLTMRTIEALTDLGPWFSTLSQSLTKQQTKSLHGNFSRQRSPETIIERIIELDFLEPLP